MTNSAGVIQAQYYYSPFGESTKISGVEESDFRFAGYFIHQRSKLCKPIYRLYSPLLGRFINRDPISERGGVNLFAYVANSPTQLTDPIGFMPKDEGQFYKQGFDFREFNYGEWGGQGLANGGHPIGGELGKFPHEGQKGWRRPLDARDWCYYYHDVCLHNAAGEKDDCRRGKRKDCDKKLGDCLSGAFNKYGYEIGDPGAQIILFKDFPPNDNKDVFIKNQPQYPLPSGPWPIH